MNRIFVNIKVRLILSLIIFLIPVLFNLNSQLEFVFYLISYLIIGVDILIKALKNIFKIKFLDENFLMSLATTGAFVTSQYAEGVMVMWLYQIGEEFQHRAVHKTRRSIKDLMNIRADYANLKKGEEILKVNPIKVEVGDFILVKSGEKVPLDGRVVEGEGMIDTSPLTGESLPKNVKFNDEVLSGCISKNGVLTLEVTKKFKESTVSKILDLVENASNKKSKAENFITKFSKIYTPIVVFLALSLAIIPPILIEGATFSDYIRRACAFLVISCPCALVISIPLGFFGGLGGASKLGILIKGSNYLEALSRTSTVVFDKTGTLTKGNFEIVKIKSNNCSEEEILEVASYAEAFSSHPIADSIKKTFGKELDLSRINDVNEIEGKGIQSNLDGNKICVGNHRLMEDFGVDYEKIDFFGTVVHVSLNSKYLGYILISDEVKENSFKTIRDLKDKNSVEKVVMLTGDNQKVGEGISKKLNINEFYAQLLPSQKVSKLEELLSNIKDKSSLVFVGDGINDAPVLMRADIGISMGSIGSDAAIEASDVVIMDDDIYKVNTAIEVSKNTIKIVKQNIILSLGVKFLVLALSAFGIASMWQAVFADVGVSFIAILNSIRELNFCKNKEKP